jgi:hypothetical protein
MYLNRALSDITSQTMILVSKLPENNNESSLLNYKAVIADLCPLN